MASKKTGDPVLRQRIKELEAQVADYKKRLDDLRRAKNTTILKREREVLEVGAPNLGARRDSKQVNPPNDKIIAELRKEYEEKLEKVKQEKSQTCNHEEEINELKRRNNSLEADNVAIMVESGQLREKVDELLQELSVKEANWCDTEEKLNLKLKMQWGEKYREWMEQTEKKIEELQYANGLLKKMVKRDRPSGPDPSGQGGY